jgi:hypothetical protein
MGGGAADEIIMTSITNPEVMAICYAQGWAANADYMTKAEAEAVTSLGTNTASAFYQNTSITHFEELQYFGVTTLGQRNFYGCTNLTKIVLPSSVVTIPGMCFYNCENLESLGYSSITSIESSAFYNCKKLEYFTFSDLLTYIGGSAFNGCSVINFTNDIPSSVTTLGTSTFANIGFTGHLTIPSNITSIPQRLVQNSKVTSVTLPSTCTEIGSYAFYGCNQMQSLTILATTPPSLGTGPFQKMTGTIYVLAASVSAYQSAWSNQASRIQAIPTT